MKTTQELRARTTGMLMAAVAVVPAVNAAEPSAAIAGNAPPSPWQPSVSISLREAYDSNVYLQDVTDLADRESLVTTVTPSVGMRYQRSKALVGSVTYAPDVVVFHSEPTEDHAVHRAGITLGGEAGSTTWDWQNNLLAIDGPEKGVTFTGPGGAPAAGGPAIRDRRDAAIYRGGVKLTQTWGKWFVRPVVTAYVHDFQAKHLNVPGYLNYVDRNEFTGGVDLGRDVATGFRAGLGYRYGRQDQAALMSFPEEYDSAFHRVLGVLEGKPWSWLKLGVSAGPEFRRYGPRVSPAFGDRDELNFFVDAAATVNPTAADTVTLSVKQFEQPSFGGRATYEDLTYDVSWRRKLGNEVTVGAGGRAYNTDFLQPAQRNDWVLSANAVVAYSPVKSVNAEVSYLYEDGESLVPNTAGRDYSRHVVALGIRYTWK